MIKDSYKLGILVTCAVRYALGRLTYIPSVVCEIIGELLPTLDTNTLSVMIKDIREHLDTNAYTAGFRDIEYSWRILLKHAEEENKGRGVVR